jgi:hypothetical protein
MPPTFGVAVMRQRSPLGAAAKRPANPLRRRIQMTAALVGSATSAAAVLMV